MLVSDWFCKKTGRSGLYNIMPIENIKSVMKNGILSHHKAHGIEHSSVALNAVQERREKKSVTNGLRLHDYVNLYFDARNPMMYRIHSLYDTLCVLKVSPCVLDLEETVITDRNAACDYVRFFTPKEIQQLDFDTIFMRNWTHDDDRIQLERKKIKCAEILVPNCIPYQYVMSAAVADDHIKQKLLNVGFDKEVYICPDLFFR